jgi:cohesin loading factor subunit SCC2
VVSACVSCLGSVVNEVTKNYKLVRDCFSKYYGHMTQYRSVYEANSEDARLAAATPRFRRALFTVGLLLKHFDFSKEELYTGLPVSAAIVNFVPRVFLACDYR